MPLLNSIYYIAQAYGCGAYSQSSYSQCAQESPPTTSNNQNPQSTGNNQKLQIQSGSSSVSQSAPTDQAQLQQTATPEQSREFFEPSQTIGQPSTVDATSNPIARVGFDSILLLSFISALIIAIILWLLRRRRRGRPQQFNDTTHYPPSQPPIT